MVSVWAPVFFVSALLFFLYLFTPFLLKFHLRQPSLFPLCGVDYKDNGCCKAFYFLPKFHSPKGGNMTACLQIMSIKRRTSYALLMYVIFLFIGLSSLMGENCQVLEVWCEIPWILISYLGLGGLGIDGGDL